MAYDFSNIITIVRADGTELQKITNSAGSIIWQKKYIWKKYTVATTEQNTGPYEKVSYGSKTDKELMPRDRSLKIAESYTLNTSTGKFSLTNPVTTNSYNIGGGSTFTGYYLCGDPYSGNVTATSGNYLYEITGRGLLEKVENNIGQGYYPYINYKRYRSQRSSETVEIKGTYISDVYSVSSTTYPTDGKHTDGYWYVKQ